VCIRIDAPQLDRYRKAAYPAVGDQQVIDIELDRHTTLFLQNQNALCTWEEAFASTSSSQPSTKEAEPEADEPGEHCYKHSL
jgi:hypothetical protein